MRTVLLVVVYLLMTVVVTAGVTIFSLTMEGHL